MMSVWWVVLARPANVVVEVSPGLYGVRKQRGARRPSSRLTVEGQSVSFWGLPQLHIT